MANTGYGYGSYLSKSLRDQSSSTLVMTEGVSERFLMETRKNVALLRQFTFSSQSSAAADSFRLNSSFLTLLVFARFHIFPCLLMWEVLELFPPHLFSSDRYTIFPDFFLLVTTPQG